MYLKQLDHRVAYGSLNGASVWSDWKVNPTSTKRRKTTTKRQKKMTTERPVSFSLSVLLLCRGRSFMSFFFRKLSVRQVEAEGKVRGSATLLRLVLWGTWTSIYLACVERQRVGLSRATSSRILTTQAWINVESWAPCETFAVCVSRKQRKRADQPRLFSAKEKWNE